MRLTPALITLAALASVLTGCGEDVDVPEPKTFQAGGTFGADAKAMVYDRKLVPAKAAGEATLTVSDARVVAELSVTGLVPDRPYGAHAHVNPCGSDGDAAGPHFQQKQDPVQPSVDPKYANPENEIWLDFATDAKGAAQVESAVDWKLEQRRPASIVIHEKHTHTEPGEAGKAGDRLACLTLSAAPS